jgi:ATP-dependent RNA helicase DeaD
MVRLSFGLGKAEQIRPTMVVGAIANEAKIPGKAVGAITIQQHETFVDVSEQYVDQVINKLKRLEFFGKPARLKRQG